MKKRVIALALGCTVAFGCAVGGTLAWLTDNTEAVTNTFVAGQIGSLNLTETDTDSDTDGTQHSYTVIPGVAISKDPKVNYTPTTTEGTVPVDAYVFVELTSIGENKWTWNTTASQYEIKSGDNVVLSFQIADGWTAVDGVSDVYYKTSTGTTGLTDDPIIKDNKITVSNLITKDDVNAVSTAANGLTFTAYAIQQANGGADNEGKFTPVEAWDKVKPSTN